MPSMGQSEPLTNNFERNIPVPARRASPTDFDFIDINVAEKKIFLEYLRGWFVVQDFRKARINSNFQNFCMVPSKIPDTDCR